MCRDWELWVAVPGFLAWLTLLAAAVLTLAARATALTQAFCIACVTAGMACFLLAAGLGGVCDRAPPPSSWPPRKAPWDPRSDPSRAEVRMKLHLGATLGALPALGGAAMLALLMRARRDREPAVPPARRG